MIDPNYLSPRSCTTPLIIAAKSSQQNAILELLQAGANANVADDQGNPPLHLATENTDLQSMRLLLTFGAYADDESLHIAARNVQPDAIKLLLEEKASVDFPGFRCCEGRTALNELCIKASSPVDNSKLKASLKILLEAGRELSGPCANRSPFFFALDNQSLARELTQTILALSASLRDELNSDINIYRKTQDSSELCYSLTMYVRHFRCQNSPRNARGGSRRRTSYRPDPNTSCCGSSTCPAPTLEQLLCHYGCQYRYWDEKGGANQPAGVCNPPSHIVEAQQEAEKEAKKRAEHQRRLKEEADVRAAMMETKEAEAAHERQLARERKQRKQEEIDVEKEDARRRREIGEANAHAESRLVRKREEEEEQAFRKQQSRLRRAEEEQDSREKRRLDNRLRVAREEASIKEGTMHAQKKLLDKTSSVLREMQLAGASALPFGRVLGEIEEGQRALT